MNASLRVHFRAIARLLTTLVVAALVATACSSSGVAEIAAESSEESDDIDSEAVDSDSDSIGSDTTVDSEAALPENPVLGNALSQFTDDGTDDAVGQPAPDLDGVSLKGERIQITQANGRGKIYGFFAHWCPHCQDEVPLLVDYLETNRLPDNVDFHAVSTAVDESRENYPPVDWFDAEDWPFPVLDDSAMSAIAASFGLPAFPYFVVVDGDGNVVQRIAGGLPDEAAITAVIEAAEGS